MLLTVENLQAINDAVKAANEAKAKAENDLLSPTLPRRPPKTV